MGFSIDIGTQAGVSPITADKGTTSTPAAAAPASSQTIGSQEVKDLTGAVIEGGTQDGISVDYNSTTGTADFTNTDKGSVAVAAHEATNNVHEIADVAGLQTELDLAPFESTGSVTGFGLSVFSTTQVTIAPGTAIFVDFSDPAAPLQTQLDYAGANVTITGIAIQLLTYLAINSAGTILQQSTPFTAVQRRSVVPLGTAVHTNFTSVQTTVNTVSSIHSTGNQLHDLLLAVGALNTDGNVYGPNGANLSLNRSAGSVFKFGANNNYDDPHNLAIAAMTAGNLFYNTGTGVITGPTTTVDVTNYESSPGVLSTVSNNKFTIQRIYLFTTGTTRIQYGTVEYDTIEDATAALETEAVTTPPAVQSEGILRAYLIVEKAATDLSNPAEARFFPVGKFGGASAGGTALTSANIIAALGYTPEDDAALPAHVADADPHTQYVKVASLSELVDDRVAALLVAGSNITLTYDDTLNTLTIASTGGGGGVTDHGALTGLGDDDHPQYHNDARGDARYLPIANPAFTGTETGPVILLNGSTAHAGAQLGIRDGASSPGVTPNTARDALVIESTVGTGISILTPNTSQPGIAFGDPENAAAGQMRYDHATDTWDVVTSVGASASSRVAINSTALTSTVPLVSSGTTPVMAWYETDQVLPLGRWRTYLSGNVWTLARNTAVAGDFSTESSIFQISTTACTINMPILMNNGSSSAPSHSFSSDTGLGMWRGGAGILNFALGAGNFPVRMAGSATTSGIFLGDLNSTGDGGTLQSSTSVTALTHERVSGGAVLDLGAAPADGTSASTLRINRQTNTSGAVRIDIHRGNASSTLDHRIQSGTTGPLVALCQNGGDVTIGGQTVFHTGDVSALDSGTWTPTLTNITNVAASTAFAGSWMRVGDTVSCSVGIDIDPTAASVSTSINISLPVASALATLRQLSGNGVRIAAGTLAPVVGGITGETVTDTARLTFINDADVSNRAWVINFQYQVV